MITLKNFSYDFFPGKGSIIKLQSQWEERISGGTTKEFFF
jgi:hypothetical protein